MDLAPVAAAGVMAMTWGDALAALVGQRYGQHRYQVGASSRSWEGSVVMFLSSALVIFLVLLLLPGSELSPLAVPWGIWQSLLTSLLAAGAATLVEAVSPHGTDNISVPLVAALVVWAMASMQQYSWF